jgi:hypothetical protein
MLPSTSPLMICWKKVSMKLLRFDKPAWKRGLSVYFVKGQIPNAKHQLARKKKPAATSAGLHWPSGSAHCARL